MRIAVVDWYAHVNGGAEAYVKVLLPALIDAGHEVAFLHGECLQRAEGSICAGLDVPMWWFDELRPRTALDGLRRWKPDVVYVHSQNSQALENAILDEFPSALFAHGYHGTCGTGAKTFRFPRTEPCTRRFGLACLALHYPRRCGGLHPVTTFKVHMQQRARFANLQRYGAVLVASRHMVAEFLNHGVAAEKLHLAPLPLTSGRRDPSPPEYRRRSNKLLMISRLTREKGGDSLLRALPSAAEALGYPLELTVAGDGAEKDSLERLAKSLSLPVNFTGWVQPAERTRLMCQADLLAVPSLWPEPFGLVGLEAASVGLPAVAYDTGGVTDWLESGVTGEIAPGRPPTVEGLAAAIVRALQDDVHYQGLRLGAWAKSSEFDMAAHLGTVLDALSETAARGADPETSLAAPRVP